MPRWYRIGFSFLFAACLLPRPGSASEEAPSSSLAAQMLLEKYYQGVYREVGMEGLVLLEREPENLELRFIVANSLAWSGQSQDALGQYEVLAGTEYHDRALLGWGNVQRWNGRPDRAASAYRQILEKDPDNRSAAEGLLFASRELRDRSQLLAGRAGNSNDANRTWFTLAHKWRDESGAQSFELAASDMEENRKELRVVQRELAFRHEALDARLAPQLEVTLQESPHTQLFGNIMLKIADTPVYIGGGRLNWGKLAFDPQALQDRLTAVQVTARASPRTAYGALRLAYDANRVSDGNLVQNASLRLTPSWQLFQTPALRIFIGAEARKARFNDPRYWSPREGHYNAFAGFDAEHVAIRWQGYASLQYGAPLTADSGHSWSSSLGARYWLGDNWALAFDLWALDTPRNGGYRSASGILRIERLW